MAWCCPQGGAGPVRARADLAQGPGALLYLYRPAQPEGKVVGAMVRDFVNRVFNGSAELLLVHLVEEHNLTPEDLEDIAKLRRIAFKMTRAA